MLRLLSRAMRPIVTWLLVGQLFGGAPSTRASAGSLASEVYVRGSYVGAKDQGAALPTSSPQDPRACRIPFTLLNGLIVMQGDCGGVPVYCILDSGARYLFWGKNLHLPIARRSGKITLVVDGAGRVLKGAECTIADLRLGDYEAKNIFGLEWQNDDGAGARDDSKMMPALGSQVMFINLSVFDGAAVTIDYDKRDIEVIPGGAKAVPAARAVYESTAIELAFRMQARDRRRGAGTPTVETRVAGTPITLVVDTGCTSSGVVLEPKRFKSLPDYIVAVSDGARSKSIDAHVVSGQTTMRVLPHVQLDLLPAAVGATMPGQDVDVSEFSLILDHADGVMGESVLSAFSRVTFDLVDDRMFVVPKAQPRHSIGTIVRDGVIYTVWSDNTTSPADSSLPPHAPAPPGYMYRYYPGTGWTLVPIPGTSTPPAPLPATTPPGPTAPGTVAPGTAPPATPAPGPSMG